MARDAFASSQCCAPIQWYVAYAFGSFASKKILEFQLQHLEIKTQKASAARSQSSAGNAELGLRLREVLQRFAEPSERVRMPGVRQVLPGQGAAHPCLHTRPGVRPPDVHEAGQRQGEPALAHCCSLLMPALPWPLGQLAPDARSLFAPPSHVQPFPVLHQDRTVCFQQQCFAKYRTSHRSDADTVLQLGVIRTDHAR